MLLSNLYKLHGKYIFNIEDNITKYIFKIDIKYIDKVLIENNITLYNVLLDIIHDKKDDSISYYKTTRLFNLKIIYENNFIILKLPENKICKISLHKFNLNKIKIYNYIFYVEISTLVEGIFKESEIRHIKTFDSLDRAYTLYEDFVKTFSNFYKHYLISSYNTIKKPEIYENTCSNNTILEEHEIILNNKNKPLTKIYKFILLTSEKG